MAFSSSNLYQIAQGSLVSGRGAIWGYQTAVDSSATVAGAGYFAAVMRGSRASNMGISTGDFCLVSFGSTSVRLGFFSASTADQASTAGSTGWNAAYNGTLVMA